MSNYIKFNTNNSYGNELSLVTERGEFRIPFVSVKINVDTNEIMACNLEVELKELIAKVPISKCDYKVNENAEDINA